MDETELLISGHGVWRVFAFVVGLSVGSFLNVVIARVPEGLSVVKPRSRCPRCGHGLAWFENIPLLSWLVLRGRCRGCRAPISLRYPMVEFLTGLLALALWDRFGAQTQTLTLFVFVALLVAITYIDLEHWIIPHLLTWPGIALGLAGSFFFVDPSWQDALIGALGGFFVFAGFAFVASRIFNRDALGAGDWWLLAMIGAHLGWQALLPVILLASVQGSVVGILLIALGKAEGGEASDGEGEEETEQAPLPGRFAVWRWPLDFLRFLKRETVGEGTEEEQLAEEEAWVPPRNAVPFGPFLALGALEELFVGEWLRGVWDGLLSGWLG